MDKELKNTFESSDFEELDIKFLGNFFIRNKFFIGIFSFSFFVFAALYSLTLRKVWEGQFQIVLNKNTPQKMSSKSFAFSPFSFPKSTSLDLKTEVAILESPSVLMPIFEYVFSEKRKSQKNITENYSLWQQNLDIDLKKGTSILNISYRDTDKKSIIPVLKKITSAYQDYSGKGKRRTEELTKKFLKEQISSFKNKSSESLRDLQDFAIKEDLNYVFLNEEDNKSIEGNISIAPSNIGIENIRVNAANDIRRIDIQIAKIKELDNSEELQYVGSTIPALVDEGLPQMLKKIDDELVEMRSKYTDNDINIINLREKRKLMIEVLKRRAIEYLKASRIEFEAIMEAAIRPKEVILEYKELLRKASRDESTLISLENQLRMIELEEAKKEDPWELITNPTLKQFPVAPNKKRISFLGLILGLFLGSLFSYFKEKTSDKFFDIKNLENKLKTNVIEKFSAEDISLTSAKVEFLYSVLNLQKVDNTYFVNLGKNIDKNLEKLQNIMNKKFGNKRSFKLMNLSDIKKFKTDDDLFLVTNFNSLKCSEIENLIFKFNVLNLKFKGIVILED